MENVIHRLTLDLARPGSGACLTVRRGDSARTLVVTLSQGGRPYRISDGVTAVFYARKSDGVPLFNSCAIEQNIVRYDFTGQTTNVAGPVDCEIRLYGQNMELLTSAPFELMVEDTVHQEGDIPDSSPEYTALTELVSKGSALVEKLDGMEEELLDAVERAAETADRADAAARQVEEAMSSLATTEYVDRIAEQLRADLMYRPIEISSIRHEAGVQEMGASVKALTVSWELSKAPLIQTLDGMIVAPEERSVVLSRIITETTAFTLRVEDERGATDEAGTTVHFYNGVYFGALYSDMDAVDSAAILSLERELQGGRNVDFTVTPGVGKRPVYACPSRYGTPVFRIRGFEYSWDKIGTIRFVNSSGYAEDYDVWMHPQNVTGNVTVNVS